MYGGQSTYIPLKVNQAGVIAIIFASSVLFLPALLVRSCHWEWLQSFVNNYILDTTNWPHLLYGLLIVGFAYFYNAIAFDPRSRPTSCASRAGSSPASGPGPQTERYLPSILNRITLPGALFIAFIALLPSIVLAFGDVTVLPVRWHDGADRRRCGPRDDEADRQPADDAELRGLPEVSAAVIPGAQARHPRAAGRRQGNPVRRACRATTSCRTSRPGDILRAAVREGRRSAPRPGGTWTLVSCCPTT